MIQVNPKIAGLKLALAECERDIAYIRLRGDTYRLYNPEYMNTEEYKQNTIKLITLVGEKIDIIKAELAK